MNIREAQLSDADALAMISITTWQATYSGFIPQNILDSITLEARTQRWKDRLVDPDETKFTLVAEEKDGRIAGYCGGLPERDGIDGFTGEVGDIYIMPGWQRQGIGKLLIGSVVRRLREKGHESIILWSFTDNPNITFYENLGGTMVSHKETVIAGISFPETAFGWHDLTIFDTVLKFAA